MDEIAQKERYEWLLIIFLFFFVTSEAVLKMRAP